MINLSYIIATRNRLPFVTITLSRLIDELQHDEEIVIVDGGSGDGTKEYLEKLYHEGKIHQYVSEPDKNQAHGWNKAMLMARGAVIKKIIDDDVFCYPAIRACKAYMLQNPDVDAVISNDLHSSLATPEIVTRASRFKHFLAWKDGREPVFTFGDVHLLIRRSALAYIGLYNTAYINIDWEYSLRMTSLKANITYYTGYNALSVSHPGTVTSRRDAAAIREEGRKGELLYGYKGDAAEISAWSKAKIFAGKKLFAPKAAPGSISSDESSVDKTAAYDTFYKALQKASESAEFQFIHK